MKRKFEPEGENAKRGGTPRGRCQRRHQHASRGKKPCGGWPQKGRGGEREDPEGANVRRVASSGSGETGFGSGALSVGSKAPRSVQAWEGSRSAQADEELQPQQRIPTRKGAGVRARWARRAEGDGNPGRQTTAQEHRTGRPVPIDGWSNPGDETLEVPVGWNKPASRRWLGSS